MRKAILILSIAAISFSCKKEVEQPKEKTYSHKQMIEAYYYGFHSGMEVMEFNVTPNYRVDRFNELVESSNGVDTIFLFSKIK